MTSGTVSFAAVATLLLFIAELRAVSSAGSPILLVPGITGSQLDVRHGGFNFCKTFGQSIGLWVSEVRFLKFGCFGPELTLQFDEGSGQFSSSDDDVTVTVPGFGDTNTVEQLGQGIIDIPYFRDFVDYFVARGYERGKSIRAAPYDWRLAPEELQRMGYHNNLKSLIETMFTENGNDKVTITAHSMGAPTILHFLTQSGVVDQEWKDKYIGNFVTLAGAWSGGNLALQVEISGLSLSETIADIFGPFQEIALRIADPITGPLTDKLTPIIRTFQSLSFLLPRPSVWGDRTLVTTPSRTYTANDYEDLFSDINLPTGFAKFQGIEGINADFPDPNVPTHCFYGVSLETPESFTYSKSFPEGAEDDPEVTMGDGDGTVNVLSSEVCLRWANSGSPFTTKTFEGVGHQEILGNGAVLEEIRKIVGASPTPTPFWVSFFNNFG